MGIACMIMSRMAGVVDITITDINDFRLEKAEKLGASAVINSSSKKSIPKMAFDCAIEASGAKTAFADVLQAIKKGGHISFVGMSNIQMPFDLNQMQKKEAKITGVYRYVNTYEPVLKILSKLDGSLSELVTHHYELSDLSAAINTALDPNINSMKIVIKS